MRLAFWFTVEAGRWRVPVPLLLGLPLTLVIDLVALVALTVVGIIRKQELLVRLGVQFLLSRLIVALMLNGGRLRISVQEGDQRVRIFGGWRY